MTYARIEGETAQIVRGGSKLTSLDGSRVATLRTITADGWPENFAQDVFGLYKVDTTPPEGKVWTGGFVIEDGLPVAVFEDIDPEEARAQERAAMSCSRMQGILTLGEEKWGEVLTYRETATWAEKIIIDDSGQWERVSENIEFIGYLVGYSDEQMDDLFRAAMLVKA